MIKPDLRSVSYPPFNLPNKELFIRMIFLILKIYSRKLFEACQGSQFNYF